MLIEAFMAAWGYSPWSHRCDVGWENESRKKGRHNSGSSRKIQSKRSEIPYCTFITLVRCRCLV